MRAPNEHKRVLKPFYLPFVKGSATCHAASLSLPLNLQNTRSGAPTITPSKPVETFESLDLQQYAVNDPREAYWRVMIDNPENGDVVPTYRQWRESRVPRKSEASLVGPRGHLERANAWTHMAACLAFCAYAILRVVLLGGEGSASIADKLPAVSIIANAVMFAVSVVFHVYSTVVGCAIVVRMLDHTAIYITVGINTVADLAVVTSNFDATAAQVVADPIIAVVCITSYFVVHRALVPREETADFMFGNLAHLGLFRYFHSDLEHAGLRTAGVTALTTTWILMVPAALSNLPSSAAAIWIASVASATVLLGVGLFIDNTYGTERAFEDTSKPRKPLLTQPDLQYGHSVPRRQRCLQTCACSSKRLGCVMTSHAWWHVISFASTCLLVAAREFAVQTL